MLSFHAFYRRSIITVVSILCLVSILTACQESPATGTTVSPASSNVTKSSEYPKAKIIFEAQVPSELAEGQNLYLEFLDEVTGLALNASRTRMESEDGKTFTADVPFVLGTVVKYRYVRDNDPIGIEYNSLGRQVRYRMYFVEGPGTVKDLITAWKSEPAVGNLGRIQGQIADKTNNGPVVNALVSAGGVHTLSASDGSFLLEGLPPGTHNLVAYSMDGAFRPFQQGAVVAPESTTPALVLVAPSPTVKVTFVVRPPEDNLNGVPVRLVGNTYSLGNTFADLSGGVSVLASRAPFLSLQPDGRYSLTLNLPVGMDLRYKYTLGDGFWNAERSSEGSIRLRQLIVPDKDITIEDAVDTWKTKGLEPVSFTVTVPENTPSTDTISIQFNPYGWTEPIPMWSLGNNRWFYILYNPLNLFQNASYRYCRNEQCGLADSTDTMGKGAAGKPFSPTNTPQDIQETIPSWAWMDSGAEPVVVSAGNIDPKEDFLAGVEWMPYYHPSWQPYLGSALQNIKDTGANAVILSPTWRLTHKTPPVIEPVPGQDPLWHDLTGMALQAQQRSLSTILHPVLIYNEDPQTWWQSAARNDGWWQSWFDQYRTFLIYHADLATQTGAKALVLGDENILPALPSGTLADGSESGVPSSAEERWKDLISEVRSRYTGKLVWMVPYGGSMEKVPAFLADFDWIYVQVSAPLATSDQATQTDIEAAVSASFDTDIQKLQQVTEKPVFIGLKFPSVSGVLDGCADSSEKCLPASAYDQPGSQYPSSSGNLKVQADAYSAVLSVINQRDWVNGFFAVGYYPPAEVKDFSVSVHGKPAGDVLWYWFPRILGTIVP